MTSARFNHALKYTVSACALTYALTATIASAKEQMAAATVPTTAVDEVVVNGIIFRNRTEDTAPVLSYDLEYF